MWLLRTWEENDALFIKTSQNPQIGWKANTYSLVMCVFIKENLYPEDLDFNLDGRMIWCNYVTKVISSLRFTQVSKLITYFRNRSSTEATAKQTWRFCILRLAFLIWFWVYLFSHSQTSRLLFICVCKCNNCDCVKSCHTWLDARFPRMRRGLQRTSPSPYLALYSSYLLFQRCFIKPSSPQVLILNVWILILARSCTRLVYQHGVVGIESRTNLAVPK